MDEEVMMNRARVVATKTCRRIVGPDPRIKKGGIMPAIAARAMRCNKSELGRDRRLPVYVAC